MSLPVILGSSSKWRKITLENMLGYEIDTIHPDIDEKGLMIIKKLTCSNFYQNLGLMTLKP